MMKRKMIPKNSMMMWTIMLNFEKGALMVEVTVVLHFLRAIPRSQDVLQQVPQGSRARWQGSPSLAYMEEGVRRHHPHGLLRPWTIRRSLRTFLH